MPRLNNFEIFCLFVQFVMIRHGANGGAIAELVSSAYLKAYWSIISTLFIFLGLIEIFEQGSLHVEHFHAIRSQFNTLPCTFLYGSFNKNWQVTLLEDLAHFTLQFAY